MDEQVLQLLEKQSEILETLAKDRTKTPANPGNWTELHGVGSLFGSHSIEREVLTAHIRPFGLGAMLPKIPTVDEMPFFSTITGYTADTGDEATNPCDDNPYAFMKGCDLTAQYGRVARDTKTIEINEVMNRKNRGDFTDLVLMGKVLGEDTGFNIGGLNDAQILNLVTKSEMVTAGVSLERKLADNLWNGSPANNTAGGGYKEFPGLSNQVATAQVDAHTNTACAALDSDVKDFTYNDVCGSGKDIVEYVTMLEAYIQFNADRMGLAPLTGVFVMRPELWYVLSSCWPCRSMSNSCTVIDTGNIDVVPNLDAVSMSMLRDQMRQGMFIDVNGRRYGVVVDTGITEATNITNANVPVGSYASSIFFIPLAIGSGFPVTYIEHKNYAAAQPDISLLRGTQDFWTDDGKYFWAIEQTKWCYKLSVKTEQRVVLRTPQLAGRIDNVLYTPLQHFRSPDPDSPYFADGGVSLRSDESVYSVWL